MQSFPGDQATRVITRVAANVVRHIFGIDIAPAMIEDAREQQRAMMLTNMAL